MATIDIHGERTSPQAEAIQRALFARTNVAIVQTDENGVIRQFNTGATRMLGYASEEVVGKLNAVDLYDRNEVAGLARSLSAEHDTDVLPGFEVFAFKGMQNTEDRLQLAHVCKDGHRFPVLLSVTALRDNADKLMGFLLISTDYSAVSRLDERLLRAENALGTIAESISERAIAMLDSAGRVLTWNVAAERLLGYRSADAVGRNFPSFYSPEDVAHRAPRRELDMAASAGHSASESWLIREDGSALLAGIDISAIRDGSGRLSGFAVLIADLTDRRRIEESILSLEREAEHYGATLAQVLRQHTTRFRESDELLRQMTMSIPHAIWIREVESRKLLYINPVWEKMTGFPASVGEPVDQLYHVYHPDDFPLVMRESRKFPRGGIDYDCRVLRADGTVCWVRIRTFPIANAMGEVVRVAGIMEDITARREEAKRLDQLKDEFVATVSHELRTPLTSIAGSLALLARNAEEFSEPTERLIRIAQTNSERLVRLVNDILDMEKIESGHLPFDMQRIRIRALLEQTIESMRGVATASGVQLMLNSASADCDVLADPDRLAQVVTNLLSNAIKFTPSGKEVSVAIHKGTDSVRVSVRDRGPGISESFKPHIFEKFAQAGILGGRQTAGTGLGLSIAKEIVTRLGGEIGFEDAPGGGTIFSFELPDWASIVRAGPSAGIKQSDKNAA